MLYTIKSTFADAHVHESEFEVLTVIMADSLRIISGVGVFQVNISLIEELLTSALATEWTREQKLKT